MPVKIKNRPRIKIKHCRGGKGKEKGKGSKEHIANPMAKCILDMDVIPDVLTRLPLKSLVRFESVCKLCIESDEQPRELLPPHPAAFYKMHTVGSCNDMICLASNDEGVVLWNHAMKIWKFVKLSRVSFRVPKLVLYGFGYDAKSSDFKVVRLEYLKWNKRRIWFANDAILNENMYRLASLDVENEEVKDLLWFDVSELVFKIIPLASLNLEKEAKVQFVDSRGALVAVVHDINENLLKIIDFWVFDNVEQS
ncbi:hypothetical protein Salat_0054800 [Sesamum alatum]|uniref:F-box associated beta-propeller type 1 domain-containing protein n=1 Tax=Sesamum alatum TaxID=300844 RepID=A0AAE2CX05_9LAMI|nr:hypothetical protein Salat_0054800 [Sesamum alatum]